MAEIENKSLSNISIIPLQNHIDGAWEPVAEQLDVPLCNANTGEVIDHQRESSPEQLERALLAAERAYRSNGSWSSSSPAVRAEHLLAAASVLDTKAADIAALDSLLTGAVIHLTARLAAICAAAFRGAAALLAEENDSRAPGPHMAPAFVARASKRRSGGADGLKDAEGIVDTMSKRLEGLRVPSPATASDSAAAAEGWRHMRARDLLIERRALGPAAIIGPWNAPAGILSHKLASALAAGCPAIIKPSEWAPYSAQLIVESLHEAGLPGDACQLLHGAGAAGAVLAADPRIASVSFTGGLAAGRAVAAACAAQIKPAQLELGGNNPLLVLEDADLEAAACGIVTGLITLNGQWCRALGRLLVHRRHQQALLDLVAEKLGNLVCGSSLDQHSEMGPLAHRAHRELIQKQVDELISLGGETRQYTRLPQLQGWFYPPTLVTGLAPEQTMDEIFGPVACVHCFDDDAQAIHLANQTPFGLAAYVFGEQQHCWQVAEHLRSGMIKINAVTLLNLSPEAPRPAWGLSGLGDEGTRETFEFFRGTRVIGVAG